MFHYVDGDIESGLYGIQGVVRPVAKTSFKRRAATVKQQSRDITVTYKQGLFIQCEAKLVLYGGAAGG